MSTVVAVYTGQGLSGLLQGVFAEVLPGCRLVNIIDDSIIHDVGRAGGVTRAVVRRLIQYYAIATDIGADVILHTCSSVGEVVDIARQVIETPIVRIDEPMAREAVSRYEKIAALATLRTTLLPTMRLLSSQASALGKRIEVVDGLAEGAYQALIGGRPAEHDSLVLAAARRAAGQAEAIVLAQGSMARMEQSIAGETGKPVLSSPRLGVLAVKSLLEKGR